MARQQFMIVLVVLMVLVYENRGYVSHRRPKVQKPGVRSYPDVNKNNDINVCSLEQKTTINLFCYCDDSTTYMASSADCWVFNDGEPNDSPVWREFRSQANITKLTFNVRGATSQTLPFVPTEALVQLPELRTLEIVYADIGTIHSYAFANLSHLQDLALGRNNIVRLSRESIAYMEDLRVVTLEDNFIDGISNDVFAKLPALRKLYMDKNNISYIAEGAFEQLRKLEELDLSENRLTGSLSRYVFLGLVSLKRLDMRANHIERIGPDAFAELVKLEELVLEDNIIKTIDGRGFSGMINLQRLTLAENRLTTLDDGTFHHLDKLKFIDIRYNNLQTLSFNTIQPIVDRLRNGSFIIYLQGNVFDCDCGLLWMNRLAAETSNDQVRRALSEVQCLMNETSDDDQMDFGTGGQKTYGVAVADRVVGGVGRSGGGVGRSGGGDIPGVAVGGMRGYEGKFNVKAADDGGSSGAASGVSDEIYKSYDESQLIKVSRMNEDTCPSKEQPLVDGAPAGAPDAAQNSDRVLWESNKSSGVVATVRRSGPLSVLIFSSISIFALLRTRLR